MWTPRAELSLLYLPACSLGARPLDEGYRVASSSDRDDLVRQVVWYATSSPGTRIVRRESGLDGLEVWAVGDDVFDPDLLVVGEAVRMLQHLRGTFAALWTLSVWTVAVEPILRNGEGARGWSCSCRGTANRSSEVPPEWWTSR